MDKPCLLDCEAAKELERENKKLKEKFNEAMRELNWCYVSMNNDSFRKALIEKIKILKELEAGE